ncbi:2-C-methyl-D-erythritol 4-phosphate cytidylyltransferase [bacterium]|nr:2-C-methyl-D-erythritol 4-phosphate cytidylyltransferase [bacterium]
MSTAAIITAGGKGSRFGGEITKQFITIEGKSILSHVISRFDSCDLIDAVYIAVPEKSIQNCIDKCIEPFKFQKVKKVIPGGKERSDSVYNCLEVVDESYEIVVIHDGVRIFVSDTMIQDSINAAKKYGASICAIPLRDTIKSVSKKLFIRETKVRDNIFCVQTPQAFKRELILKAFKKAGLSRGNFTDDSSFIEKYTSCKVKVVKGSIFNLKITEEEDLLIARLFLRAGV